MLHLSKNDAFITLITHTPHDLDEAVMYILRHPVVDNVDTGQTYRTYQSDAVGKAKTFRNTVYYTNAIAIHFNEEIDPKEAYDNLFKDLNDQKIIYEN